MKKITSLLIILIILFLNGSITNAQYFNTYKQLNQDYFNQNTVPLSAYTSSLYSVAGNYNTLDSGYWNFPNINRSSRYTPNFQSTWLNHPPIVSYGPELPITFSAGQSGMAGFMVIEPDFDILYTSSSIGSMGRYTDGSPVWSFSTNFPGWYSLDTAFYDERGGFAIARSPVYVKPWWSF